MCAAHHQLDNLTAIIDYNTLQITGPTRDVCDNSPIDDKFTSFGWTVRTVDGHNLEELTAALTDSPVEGRPTVVIANTIKGKGVSFMEANGQMAPWSAERRRIRTGDRRDRQSHSRAGGSNCECSCPQHVQSMTRSRCWNSCS